MAAEVCGLEIEHMPDHVTPLAALVVVKGLDEDGEVTLGPLGDCPRLRLWAWHTTLYYV